MHLYAPLYNKPLELLTGGLDRLVQAANDLGVEVELAEDGKVGLTYNSIRNNMAPLKLGKNAEMFLALEVCVSHPARPA